MVEKIILTIILQTITLLIIFLPTVFILFRKYLLKIENILKIISRFTEEEALKEIENLKYVNKIL